MELHKIGKRFTARSFKIETLCIGRRAIRDQVETQKYLLILLCNIFNSYKYQLFNYYIRTYWERVIIDQLYIKLART